MCKWYVCTMNISFVIRNNHINNLLMSLNGLDNSAQSPPPLSPHTKHANACAAQQPQRHTHNVFHFGWYSHASLLLLLLCVVCCVLCGGSLWMLLRSFGYFCFLWPKIFVAATISVIMMTFVMMFMHFNLSVPSARSNNETRNECEM